MSTPRRNESMNENNGQEVKQAFSGVRKPRFKWTLQIHQRFVDAVNQLGGRYKATPKNIMTLMDIEQITTDHIKSHLQKYRHNGPKQANTNTTKSKKCCFHEFFCDKRNSISTTSSRTQVQHNTGIAYNGRYQLKDTELRRQSLRICVQSLGKAPSSLARVSLRFSDPILRGSDAFHALWDRVSSSIGPCDALMSWQNFHTQIPLDFKL
nr:protein PHOSPHATE STARVATION RESPONSE 3-like isoform X1 [Ipomoea batatas]